MATSERSNDSIFEQLRNGIAKFVLLSSPVRPIPGSNAFTGPSTLFQGTTNNRFFARIAPPAGFTPSMKKIERYSVQKVTGDGRCMFRALVKGMAMNKGARLSPRQETVNADELRMAVKEVICDDEKERQKYQEAVVAITVEESLKRYCQRIRRSDFWGGESELLVYPYGAHVTSWKTEDGEELLFVSKKATFEPPKPIIGGIPIYFPHASFTMTRKWRMEDNKTLPQEKDKVYFDFILEHKDGEIPHWPHRFSFRQRIALKKGGALELTSCVRNDDTKPFSFSLACPIHLAVSNIDDIRVEGLEDSMEYTNILDENDITFEPPFFDEEVSRIYGGAPSMIKVIDHHRKRTYCIKKEGFPDIVVWNPWDKSKTMIDCCNPCGKEEPENLIALEDDEYKTMLCIGAAAVSPINLQPQDEWRGIQEITMLPTSNPPLTPS